MKLTVLIGLPASGKTRYAMQNRGPNDVVVCRDDLRMMNYGVWHGAPIDENFITKQEKQMMISAFENGQNVISANTNLNKTNVQRMVNIAAQFGAEVEYVYFDVAPKTCIAYDEHRDKKVGAKVINRMARKAGINEKGFIPRHDYYYHEIKPYNPPVRAAAEVLIVDIDGTIALKSDRSPYDYSRVYEDSVREDVMNVLNGWFNEHLLNGFGPAREIIFLSGRSAECREQTIKWLKDKVGYDIDEHVDAHLFMRPADDPSTADFIVKDRLFDECINSKYNVIGVFDDRRQVVQMWRTKGLTVFDVAGNKF